MKNFRALDLNLLHVFEAVMAEGSLTRAAQTLAMTQPAVSHALKRLHQAVGEVLFVRTATGMRPTPRAEALWPQVRSALAGLQQALSPDDFDPQRDAIGFRLAMADATAAWLLPPIMQSIEQQRALTNIRTMPLTTRDPRPLLDADECDLAVGYFPDTLAALAARGAAEATLRHARLGETRYVCAMRRGHPLAEADLTLDAYCQAHHLLVSFSGRAFGFVDRRLAALGRQRRIVLTVNQFFTAGRVVTQTDLLTVLPESFTTATGYHHELVTRPLPFELGTVEVEMLWHLRHDGASAQRWLRREVERAAALAQA